MPPHVDGEGDITTILTKYLPTFTQVTYCAHLDFNIGRYLSGSIHSHGTICIRYSVILIALLKILNHENPVSRGERTWSYSMS